MKVFVLLFLMAIPAALQAQSNSEQSSKVYTASRVALYSSLALDIATTERVLRNGGRELNPLLGQNPYRRNATAIGLTLAGDLLGTRWLRKNGHPKLATVTNFVLSGLHFGAGIHNARQLRF
jgi:hypothetical protein